MRAVMVGNSSVSQSDQSDRLLSVLGGRIVGTGPTSLLPRFSLSSALTTTLKLLWRFAHSTGERGKGLGATLISALRGGGGRSAGSISMPTAKGL